MFFRKPHRLRQRLLAILSIATFLAIEARLYQVQILQHDVHLGHALYQQHKTIQLMPQRGDILDRNARLLAGSLSTDTIVLDTRAMDGKPAPDGLVKDLAEALGQPVKAVQAWFARPGRYYAYRKANLETSGAVMAATSRAKAPDQLVEMERSSKRNYPNGSLAAHVLGYTTIDKYGGDNVGQEGVEAAYDARLRGNYRKVSMLSGGGKLRRGGLMELDAESIQATQGHALVLSLDQRVQHLAETALSRAVGVYQAKDGVAIVMDVPTGEILALANCPAYDPNTFRSQKTAPEQLRNRVLTDPIEVGSVMKIITTSLLLDNGLVRLDEPIDCKGGSAWVGGRVIKDAHAMGVVPFREVFAESSNIGFASLADARLESKAYEQGLRGFGLGRPTGVDLPGEGTGILRPVDKWTLMSKASLAIGYEASLTPMQVIAVLGAIGNNGWRMRPHVGLKILDANNQVIQEVKPEPLGRPVSAETCHTILGLMESVVLEGTAKNKGIVPGYRVGGKTGTAVKHTVDANGNKLYLGSFAGLAPIDRPKLAIYVYIDEPHGAKYGGDVAYPVFREICMNALPMLGVAPSDPAAWQAARAAEADFATSMALLGQGAATAVAMTSAPDAPGAIPAVAMTSAPDAPGAIPATSPSGLANRAALGQATGPVMPDCHGLTMLKAWEKLGRVGIQANMLGSGVAVSQKPAAGARLAKGQAAEILFEPLGERAPARLKTNGAPVKLKAR